MSKLVKNIVSDNSYLILSNTVKGKNKIENQDSFNIFYDDNKIICCIADGLGSAPYSKEGSELVVNLAIDLLKNDIDSNFQNNLKKLWKEKIGFDFDLYDTTFKFVKITKEIIQYGSIGDGWIGFINGKDYISELVDHEFANQTDTLMADHLDERFYVKEVKNNLDIIILATDGFSEDIEKDDSDFLKDVSKELEDNCEAFQKDIDKIMNDWPVKSNHDDKTIIIVKKVRN